MGVEDVKNISFSENSSYNYSSTVSNPFLNCIFGDKLKPNMSKNMSKKEQLYENIANLPKDLQEKFLKYLEEGTTPKDFIDLLNERYEKKQAEFEVAWAEYQQAKDNLKLLEKIYLIIENKYSNSESDFEISQVKNAKKAFNNGELSASILLSKASDIAHRVIG